MKSNLLQPLLHLLFSSLAFAQNPVSIPLKTAQPIQNQADWLCNYAGTFEVGQFIGESNDTDLYTIFLCEGDSILFQHHGDADLSGDPIPATTPGIAYVFYGCSPSISGPTLYDISNDPCVFQINPNDFFVSQSVPNGGDSWFFNNGMLQTNFNQGQPLSLFFAPITIDDFTSNTYETSQPGLPAGLCVHANVDEAFEVVYLNKIAASDISNSFGNDCIGRFTARNGYPQFDGNAHYAIDISLASDPAVKAVVLNTQSTLFHLASVQFSTPQAGLYNVNIEDGKSCGHQFQVDMSGCDASDNIQLDFEEVAGAPGEVVCVPLRVNNFEILDGIFSICWDSNYLKFVDFSNVHPAIANFFQPNSSDVLLTPYGMSLILLDDINYTNISIPDGEAIFELCFEVLDTLNNCTPIDLCNTITGTLFESQSGTLAVSTLPGGVCSSVATKEGLEANGSKIFPNPVKVGEPVRLNGWVNKNTAAQLCISNMQGMVLQTKPVELTSGQFFLDLPTDALTPGVYWVALQAEGIALAVYKVVVFN